MTEYDAPHRTDDLPEWERDFLLKQRDAEAYETFGRSIRNLVLNRTDNLSRPGIVSTEELRNLWIQAWTTTPEETP